MKKTSFITVSILLLLCNYSFALLPDFTKEQLIIQSESIVYGEVVDSYSAWADDNSQIYTYITFNIESQFKGDDLGQTITIQIPGGKVGDITQVTTNTPTMLPGTKMAVHLFMQDNGYLWVYGWEKGALVVSAGYIDAYDLTLNQFRSLVQKTLNNR